MNNQNNEDDISKFKKIQSPSNLTTIAAVSIIKQIEKADNQHIYMLKNNIPQTLFESIENAILTIFHDDNFTNVNLARMKNLLPANLFEKNMKIYLNKIIEKNLVNVNIAQIRDNVSHNIYTLFLEVYLQDENCWEYFLENILFMRKEEILTLLNFLPLNSEQYLVLINTPNSVSRHLMIDDNYVIVVIFWRDMNEQLYSAYCRNCIERKSKIIKEVQIFSVNVEKLIGDIFKSHRYWCSKCLNTPLFNILDNDRTFIGFDHFDD